MSITAVKPTIECHQHCFACTATLQGGLGLEFELQDEHHLWAEIEVDARFQGYDGCVHGGIIATILDAAMTNLLLKQDIPAMTAKLDIRFKTPMRPRQPARVQAELVQSRSPLFELRATITQSEHLIASAHARFMLPDSDYIREIMNHG